jgi:GNAT superfamily N-acetyltransferase
MKKSDLPLFESIWSQSGLRELKHKLGKFNSYYAPFCIYPLSSPVFGRGRFSQKDIDSLEKHFKTKRKGQKPFIFIEGKVNSKNWEERGYHTRAINVCYLTQSSKEVELPKGYTFDIIKFSSKRGKDIYREVACKIFGLDEKFLNGFQRLCKKMSPNNHLVVIYNRNKIPVALTGVVCFGKIGFLHSVCVLPRFQGKGLSSWFMNECLGQANSKKSEVLIYTSSNQKMIGQANAFKVITYLS